MNENEEVDGVADALTEMANNLNELDEEEVQVEEVEEEVPADPGDEQEPDLADQIIDRLQQRTAQVMQQPQREMTDEEFYAQFPDGVPAAVMQERVTKQALQVIQVQQTVQDEVEETITAYESKFGPVPQSVKNDIKAGLRHVPPQNMRQGLGREAARYYIGEAMEKGAYTPSQPKKTTKVPGGDGRRMTAQTTTVDPARSGELDMLKNAFPMLDEKTLTGMLK